MNKKLVALAVSAIAAGAASAQTANVTLYGLVDVDLESVKVTDAKGVSTRTQKISDGTTSGLSGSRWGLRGSESLGGGLNAVFQLESGFTVDNGTMAQGGLLFGRQAYVGLNGDFGSVTAGRQYAPIFSVGDALDSPAHDFSAMSVYGVYGRYVRINNSVTYSTPVMGGLKGSAMYGFGEVAGSTSGSRNIGLSLSYADGPLYVGSAYHQSNDKNGARDGRAVLIGAGYDFGMVRPSLAYQEFTNGANAKFAAWGLTADFRLGSFVIEPQYGEEKAKDLGGGKQKRTNLTASYGLSKRTTAYASVYNQRHSGFYVTSTGVSKMDVAVVGLRHRF